VGNYDACARGRVAEPYGPAEQSTEKEKDEQEESAAHAHLPLACVLQGISGSPLRGRGVRGGRIRSLCGAGLRLLQSPRKGALPVVQLRCQAVAFRLGCRPVRGHALNLKQLKRVNNEAEFR